MTEATAITPDQAAFWPARSRRDGSEATAEQMAEAWRSWTENGAASELHYAALTSHLRRAGASEGSGKWPLHSVAEGMAQRAREAGFIKWNNKYWSLVK